MPTLLLKTEPSEFSWDDLLREGRATWDGVSNASALQALRLARKGDEAFIYHTGGARAIVGLARVLGDPYEDPVQPGRTERGEPKFAVIDLAPLRPVKTPVTLDQIKGDERFKDFALVRIGRLSVMTVPAPLDKALRKLAGL